MVSQQIWDRSQEIDDMLYQIEGLTLAMTQRIADLNLPPQEEHVLFALLHSIEHCRERALRKSARICKAPG